MYNKNDIVTVVLINGAEVIGRMVSDENSGVTIFKPRMVSPAEGPNGVTIGFVPGISMTGVEPNSEFTFPNRSVLYVLKTNDQIARGWQKTTSGLVT